MIDGFGTPANRRVRIRKTLGILRFRVKVRKFVWQGERASLKKIETLVRSVNGPYILKTLLVGSASQADHFGLVF